MKFDTFSTAITKVKIHLIYSTCLLYIHEIMETCTEIENTNNTTVELSNTYYCWKNFVFAFPHHDVITCTKAVSF